MSTANGHHANGVEPIPVDYASLLSRSARRRKLPPLRKLGDLALKGGGKFLNMGGGLPHEDTFPIVEASYRLRDGSSVVVDEKLLHTTLQYGSSEGFPVLREWLTEFQLAQHAPPTRDPRHPGAFDLVVTSGGNHAGFMVFDILLDEGDWVLVEDNSYSTVFQQLDAVGAHSFGVECDSQGMVPEALDRAMDTWGHTHPGCPRPRVVYVVPSCGNPTGVTWTLARKQAVYHVARRHGLILFEDDAYYYLQYARPVIPSLLSLDVDGRVIRCETFAKLLGPGLRLAMACGPRPLLDVMRLIKDTSVISGCGLSQGMAGQLLRKWGHAGFMKHADDVMELYKRRTDMVLRCAGKHLAGLADWEAPSGGMFVWMRVLGVEDSEEVTLRAVARHVIAVPGSTCRPGNAPSPFIRVAVSVVSGEECDQAFEILAEVIREVTAKK